MKINPYLNFNGNCREAFEFYAEALGCEIGFMQTYANSPMADDTSPELRDKIIHTFLDVNGTMLMGSDCPPDYYEKPQGISVTLQVDNTAEAERVFNALAQNGKVTMALEKTFWAERFGMLKDQFGISWMVNCDGANA